MTTTIILVLLSLGSTLLGTFFLYLGSKPEPEARPCIRATTVCLRCGRRCHAPNCYWDLAYAHEDRRDWRIMLTTGNYPRFWEHMHRAASWEEIRT